MPEKSEDETERSCIDEEQTAEELSEEEVVPEREERESHHAGVEDVTDVALVGLDSREPENAKRDHHRKPDRGDQKYGLYVSVEREIRGHDKTDTDEICADVGTDEEDDVSCEPAEEKDGAAHGMRID